MASLLQALRPESKIYWDRRTFPTYDDAKNALEEADTVYIGNLTFFATESQICDFFSCCGHVRSVKMGLNRISRKPCGFAFVQYFSHTSAVCAVEMLNGAKFDGRFIKVEMDPGYKDGRQWGRGKSGGQASDDFRGGFDAGRGGWGEKEGGRRNRNRRGGGGGQRNRRRDRTREDGNQHGSRSGNGGKRKRDGDGDHVQPPVAKPRTSASMDTALPFN